jgi:hypothetical protein
VDRKGKETRAGGEGTCGRGPGLLTVGSGGVERERCREQESAKKGTAVEDVLKEKGNGGGKVGEKEWRQLSRADGRQSKTGGHREKEKSLGGGTI